MIGLQSSNLFSMEDSEPATSARYYMHCLHASVFPDPDSPVMMMLWGFLDFSSSSKVPFAISKTWGGSVPEVWED